LILQHYKVNVDELFENCQKAINLNNKLTDIVDVQGINDIDDENIIRYRSNKEKIDNCKNDILRTKQRTGEVTNLSSEFKNFNIKDIMFNALSITDNKYFKMVDNKYHYLKTIDIKELIHIVNTIEK
jgi:hypothetical protein